MLLVVLTAGFILNARPVLATSIFINEMHYDNVGADIGEGIEIAGVAGTDLQGGALLFYNGSNGTAYDSIGLSGTLPNQMNGFGTLVFSLAGIQNGAPDGIVLVYATVVVQFLSYEGVFTAVDGPAAGMLSTDIGVLETGSDLSEKSLQLTGTGTRYEDFFWMAPSVGTFGGINADQVFLPAAPLPAPEPGTFLLLGFGIVGLMVLKKRAKLPK
jgi:hypothetical protein